jgi:lipopolysaccharide export system protein LptA
VAAAGLGTAAAIYLLARDRPEVERPIVTIPADPAATVQSGAGVDVQYVGDRKRWALEYGRMASYEGSVVRWEQVHVTFAEDGTEIWADKAEMKGRVKGGDAPAALELTGHVRLKTEDTSVESGSASYDDQTGITTIPGPVKFSRGRMSGSGTDAVYERHAGVFRIASEGRITTAADDRGPAIDAVGRTITFNRATRGLLLDGDARVTHGAEAMSAETATLYLAAEDDAFRVIELRTNARVRPAEGQTSSKTPEMQAHDIDLAFHDDVQTLERAMLRGRASIVLPENGLRRSVAGETINLTTAPDGTTLTRLDAIERVEVRTPGDKGTGERVITAASLAATGTDAKGLTQAVFTGGVRFVEMPPAGRGRGVAASRIGTGQRLTLALDGGLDAITEGVFEQNAAFEDGTVHGSADVGIYYAARGALRLQPGKAGRLAPHVKDERITVDASEQIDVDLDTRSLQARGNVKTVSVGDQAKASATSIFDAGETMYGFAESFEYDNTAKKAVYVGGPTSPARVQQSDNVVSGQRVELFDDTKDVTATGGVRSTFRLQAGTDPARKPDLYEITADRMTYQDAKQTAVYTGQEVALSNSEGDRMTAGTIVLTLMAERRALDRLEASTDVHSVLTGRREAMADVLIYEASTGRYTLKSLKGRSIAVRTQDKNGACSKQTGMTGYFTEGGATFPESENPGGSNTRSVSCTEALTR